MTTALLLAALAWHWTPPTPDLPRGLVEAIVHVESRGNTMARTACCSGLMQVSRRFSRWPAWALHVPAVGRLEGVRILRRWRRRCGGDIECALRAYATGSRALRDPQHGRAYARAVLARMR